MPMQVDSAQRLTEIAEATLRVAEREGPGAITIRRVAAELGGSTAVVTNYAASRADLLLNVIQHTQATWRHDSASHLEGVPEPDVLKALMLWSVGTVGHDQAVRHLWMDMAVKAEPDSQAHAALREDSTHHWGQVREALVRSGGNEQDADVDTDVLYLLLRGFYFLSVEDPETWTNERVAAAAVRATERLVGRPGR